MTLNTKQSKGIKMDKSDNSVVLTKVSDHGRTRRPRQNFAGYVIGQTQAGNSQWTLSYIKNGRRVSETLHCSEKEAEDRKAQVKGIE